jgi:hypothetical protein
MKDPTITPLWLSHHYPGQYDRCVVVGRRHLCRRCAVMYPFAVLVGVVALLGFELSSPWSQIALVVLPIPALVEFVGEHRGRWEYSTPRHTVVSALQGLGVGVGFVRYFHDYADPWFWGIGVLYSLIAGVAALTAPRDERLRPVGRDRSHR